MNRYGSNTGRRPPPAAALPPQQQPPGSDADGEAAQALKAEVRAFGRMLKEELDRHRWAWTQRSTDASPLYEVFRRLWEERDAVGVLMRQQPESAGRLMRRWASLKLKPLSAETIVSSELMRPSKDADRYDTRKRLLLCYVCIRLFAEMSDTYFRKGPDIFLRDAAGGLRTLTEALQGERPRRVETFADDGSEAEEPSLFDIDDAPDLRVPLLARHPSQQHSQDSMSLLQQSCGATVTVTAAAATPAAPTVYRWPVAPLLHADPAPQQSVEEVAAWLRLAITAIDMDPEATHSDHQVENYAGDVNEFKVYPFEEALDSTIVLAFALTLPLTLVAVYEELEVSPQSSKLLNAALKLKELVGDGNNGPPTPPQPQTPQAPSQAQNSLSQSSLTLARIASLPPAPSTPGTPGTPALLRRTSSFDAPGAFGQPPKKRRRKDKVSASQEEKPKLLAKELARISGLKNQTASRRSLFG
eukprot:Rhum_TRINITY_DN14748_c4_g2::Rhum_TRINITY_DN14748_c4_g2_i1::g.114617::m.114617